MLKRFVTPLLIGTLSAACAPASDTYTSASIATPTAPEEVPAELYVPAGNVESLRATGQGVQIYTCEQTEQGSQWTLSAPSAVLKDETGFVSSHGAGPNWTAPDGSSIIGSKLAESPSPDEDAVAWLLVQAEPRGAGTFANTTFLQRVDTVGGVAPAQGCSAETLGEEVRSPYSATYIFFEAANSL